MDARPHRYVTTCDGQRLAVHTHGPRSTRPPRDLGTRRMRRYGGTFAGQVAVITGTGSGIGRCSSFEPAERGARVNDVDMDGPADWLVDQLVAMVASSGASQEERASRSTWVPTSTGLGSPPAPGRHDVGLADRVPRTRKASPGPVRPSVVPPSGFEPPLPP